MRGEQFHFSCPSAAQLAIFYLREPGVSHTGILHRDGSRLYILDLQWHERLRSALTTKDYPCVIPNLEPEEINDVTALCRLLRNRHESRVADGGFKIPYAFRFCSDTRFSTVSGELMLGDGLGLTCSTFVLAVFESAFVPLIDLTEWPKRKEDVKRHQDLLQMMTNSVPPVDTAHIAAVAAEIQCIRVRPEEVAAAALATNLPSNYSKCERGGRWILELLTPDAPGGWI